MAIHCAMHAYRAATVDEWREFLGETTPRHTSAHNIAVKLTNRESSITTRMLGESPNADGRTLRHRETLAHGNCLRNRLQPGRRSQSVPGNLDQRLQCITASSAWE